MNKVMLQDDSKMSSHTSWSSEKILQEILSHRLTKFEELEDVNFVNKQDKQVVAYSADSGKFITIDLQTIGDGLGLGLHQLSKLGISGDTTNPAVVDIPISTIDFKLPKVNVLKFILGTQDIITTKVDFVNTEANDFLPNDNVILDGDAHLKKYTSTLDFLPTETIETTKLFVSNTLDTSLFKAIDTLEINEVSADTYTLDLNATIPDQLLIASGDINLSNVDNIDYFNIVASEGVKIVCSVDSGLTWKTFQPGYWSDISLNVEELKNSGMDINTFNSIPRINWNEIVTMKKIRFAYLLCDNNTISNLDLQYDGVGHWEEAKDSEYDIVYASNTLLQVKLYFNGDVKINY